MPKKKIPFVSKANSKTYSVVRRSQLDENYGTEGASDFVLVDNSDGTQHHQQQQDVQHISRGERSDIMSRRGKQLDHINELGFANDGYDYTKHMKEVSTGGEVFTSGGKRLATSFDPLLKKVSLPSDVLPGDSVERDLQSITIDPNLMDEDIRNALFEVDAFDGEELLDDFCIAADQEVIEEEDDENTVEAFDYDAHIKMLMEKSEKSTGVVKVENDEFANIKPLSRRHNDDQDNQDEDDRDEDDDDSGYFDSGEENGEGDFFTRTEDVDKDAHAGDILTEEKFAATLLEYDSDEIGELDYDDERVQGERDILYGEDAGVESALDEFIKESGKDDFYHHQDNSGKKKVGGSGYAALIKGKMVSADDGLVERLEDVTIDDITSQNVTETLQEADSILANPEMEPSKEEVFIDGKSYFTEKTINPWDCESILSTYSNLDNNPVVVGATRRKNRKKKQNQQPEFNGIAEEGEGNDGEGDEDERPHQEIKLSAKSGLPLGVLETKERQMRGGGENKGKARKGETKEEKRLRKLAVKAERSERRQEKRVNREVFAEEMDKRAGGGKVEDGGVKKGASIFRY